MAWILFSPISLSLLAITSALLFLLFKGFNDWWFPRLLPKDVQLPPGTMGWPLVGEMLEFLQCFTAGQPDAFVQRRLKKYGDVGAYRTHLFGQPTIITCTGEVNRFIFTNDSKAFTVGWPFKKFIGDSVPTLEFGDHFKTIKHLVSEAANKPDVLKKIVGRHETNFVAALSVWADKGRINLRDEIVRLTFHNICSMYLSLSPGPTATNMEKLYRSMVNGIRAYPLNFPGTKFYRAFKARQGLDRIIRGMLMERKSTTDRAEEMDLLDTFMSTKDDNGRKMNDQEILDNMVGIFLASFEPLALLMTWAAVLLAKNPEALQKLREEHESIRQNKKEGEALTLEDLRNMKYSDKVFDETQRIANISPTLYRRITKDIEYKGIFFPKGWRVLIYMRGLNMDSTKYSDPQSFNPNHWEGLKTKPFYFTPFGYGLRSCVGISLCKFSFFAFLHHLVLKYKWELVNPDAKTTYLPHPIPLDGGEIQLQRI